MRCSLFSDGTYVRHLSDGYVGVCRGTTRIKSLLELPRDEYGVRVETDPAPGARPKIASPSLLVEITAAELLKHRHGLHLKAHGFRRPHADSYGYLDRAANRYRASCWSCHHPVDSCEHLRCLSCNWLVCVCGACGCAYRLFRRNAA